MVTFEQAMQEANATGTVMLGCAYIAKEHQVTIFEIRRTGETVAIRFRKGVLFAGKDEAGQMIGDEQILKFTKFQPLIGNTDLISLPVELAVYTMFMDKLPHPYEHEHQGYQGHFMGRFASIM